MLIKEILAIIGLCHIAFAIQETKLSPLQASYQSLTDCQINICKQLYKVDSLNADSDKLKFVACQSGCNINVIDGVAQCDSKCASMYQEGSNSDELKACVQSCKSFSNKKDNAQVVDNSEVLVVDPVVQEQEKPKNIDTLDRPSRPFVNGKRPLMEIKVLDSNGNWVKPSELNNQNNNEQEQQQQDNTQMISDENRFGSIFSILNSILNRGEPNTMNTDKDDDVVIIKQIETNADDLEQEKQPQKWYPISQVHDFYNQIFNKMKDMMHSSMDDKDNSNGNFFYYAQILSNGTVIETFKKPINYLSKFNIINGDDSEVNINDEDDDEDRNMGNNMKNVNFFSNDHIFSRHYRLQECKPISFHWSTLCHDTNNFFNCLSMRYGLPKWFFLSMTLISSFLMIWMGLFILSMIKKMKRRERVIYRDTDSVDSLPLYKDLKFDEKRPISIEADDLPIKVKLDQA